MDLEAFASALFKCNWLFVCALPAPTASAPHPAARSRVSAARHPPQETRGQPSWRSSAWPRAPFLTCGGPQSAPLGTSVASAAAAGSPEAILHTEPSAEHHLWGDEKKSRSRINRSRINRSAWGFTAEDEEIQLKPCMYFRKRNKIGGTLHQGKLLHTLKKSVFSVEHYIGVNVFCFRSVYITTVFVFVKYQNKKRKDFTHHFCITFNTKCSKMFKNVQMYTSLVFGRMTLKLCISWVKCFGVSFHKLFTIIC